ncbi:hypothetical protein RHMOL_Rhmol06G0095800 [Rhododendron molle]|uniref:Uncharacterized protein n=1 Tax=Rhododendron molle TaxID=49168 RepID=A0ACC0NAN8_RHOML|nr:hypothetical protein RHMOL_Rhmol06G0095800 [Rhododendron molle]
MALETAEYPQDPFGVLGIFDTIMDHGNNIGANWDSSSSSVRQNVMECWEYPNSSPEACTGDRFFGGEGPPVEAPSTEVVRQQKRRRTKSSKNKEELESQRMTHIVVERNRRKQMNEYLAAVRSLMPASYVQRGDQASIIGGAINFVKELEHLLQTLEAHKRTTPKQQQHPPNNNGLSSPSLFADFFAFPQYSTRSENNCIDTSSPATTDKPRPVAFGDIEVTMLESHASLKVLSKRRPRQLLKLVAGLQCLRLSVLHLTVTSADQMVLYSLSVKIEDGCRLTTVDEIADAVNQLLGRVEEEAAFV